MALLLGIAVGGGGGGGRGEVRGLPGTGGGTRLARLSDVADMGSLPKYEDRLFSGDCTDPDVGIGGAAPEADLMGNGPGVSMPDSSADDLGGCIDASSSDSDPGPGEIGPEGGGGGTGRDSGGGGRGADVMAPGIGGAPDGRESGTMSAVALWITECDV